MATIESVWGKWARRNTYEYSCPGKMRKETQKKKEKGFICVMGGRGGGGVGVECQDGGALLEKKS